MIDTCLSNPAINCSFLLFQLGNTPVEINLVGAVLPLMASVTILGYYRKRVLWLRVVGFTLASFAIITAVGSAIGAIYGTIAVMGWVYILFWLLIVAWYSGLTVSRTTVWLTAGGLYVIGTFGVFLDDVIRTLLGFLNVPILGLRISPNIWGAAGPLDGIFMTGMYQVVLYLLMVPFLVKRRAIGMPASSQLRFCRLTHAWNTRSTFITTWSDRNQVGNDVKAVGTGAAARQVHD